MTSAEYTYKGGELQVTESMKNDFRNHGYVMVRNFLDSKELSQVKVVLEKNDQITKHGFGVADGEGRESMLALWSHPGTDVTGMLARCDKMVNTCEEIPLCRNPSPMLECSERSHHVKYWDYPVLPGDICWGYFSSCNANLLGGEVYHYHTKLMMKNAKTGGSHLWHQDYGYWYKNGCLYPDMLTVFIAIDRCNEENGCLEILRGSHKCGRIEHLMVAGQTGADVERVMDIKNSGHCPLELVEMEPGDALFFHCNLLHTSGPNNSPYRRWAFLTAYNKASNNPIIVHHHPQYTPLHKVPNSAILKCTNFTDMSGKDFLNPKNDKTLRVEDKNDEGSPQVKRKKDSEV